MILAIHGVKIIEKQTPWYVLLTEKKVEPKRLHPEAVLEKGATLEGGAVFSLIIMFSKKNGSKFAKRKVENGSS